MNRKEQEKLERLLKKFLAEKLTPEEEAFVAAWYEKLDSQPEKNQTGYPELEKQKNANWLALNQKLKAIEPTAEPVEGPRRILKFKQTYAWSLAAAAVILLLITFAIIPLFQNTDYQQPGKDLQIAQNNTKKVQRVSLPDGSLVWLEPGSKMQFPRQFTSTTRDIFLNGKAFFSVARDPHHPFRVYGGAVEVKVLGTSFGVDFKTNSQTAQVLVRTGQVAVTSTQKSLPDYIPFLTSDQATVRLERNEKVDFTEQADKIVKGRLGNDYWQNQIPELQLSFTDSPLEKVIQTLEDQHRVAITLENSRLKRCHLTAYFHKQPLEIKIAMICKSIGARYSVHNDKFQITGEGCE